MRATPALLLTLALTAAPVAPATAAAPPARSAAAPAPAQPAARVLARVDDNDRVVVAGHVVPALRIATDLGRLPRTTAMNHLIMVLQPSAAQDHALRTLLDQQLDRTTGSFHQWLTPEQFGARFGVADADIAQVTAWLKRQGFTVEQVARGKRFIQFSGMVGQVETAFNTEMHSYNVKGKLHVANSTDISVPAALRPVIAGVPTLHNFFKKSDFQDNGTVAARNAQRYAKRAAQFSLDDTASGPLQGKVYFLDPFTGLFDAPEYTNGTTHFVGAGDFATIYSTTPLLAAGNDGTGISIGIVARTDINLSDVQLYRTMFALKPNDPQFIVAGEDPGIVPGDDGESYLDAEVSGGAAPGAAIKFVTSRATLTTDGVDLSAMYIVQNNLTDIISESYGQCEDDFAAVQEAFFANLWAQAAAQGQSVFLSSGDNGPASCDVSTSSFETHGYAVSGLASSPFNTAVGGTLFADSAANWNATATMAPPFASALGYIPEVPWNEAKASGAVGASGLWSGSGGISAYFATPSWQHGFGVPATDPAYAGTGAFSSPASPFVAGPHRYMPDVAMAAAAQHDGTLYCGEGICQLTNTGALADAGIVGGTSVAAPTMAGIQALVDQYNGGRQGLGNYVYYTLADNQHTGGLNCVANSPTINAGCAFHDITTGNTLICANSGCTAANKIGWTAGPGYDLATGLGSPNAANLAMLWNTVTFRSSTTTLAAVPTSGITHGQPVTASGTVAPGSGTGVPTGTVAFLVGAGSGLTDGINPTTGGFLNPPPIATLDGSGNYSVNLTSLPAGTYSLVARYGGDNTFAASTSAPVTVTVAQEGSSVTIAPNAFNGTSCVETAQTTFTYGSYLWTDVSVLGLSNQGVPTGTVAITDNGNPLVTTTLNSNAIGHFLSGAIPTISCVSGYTFQDIAPLTVGTHLLGASYSGDANFGSSTAASVTVTINQATQTATLTTSSTNIASGTTFQLTFTNPGISGAGPGTLSPTGTVTFTDNTTSTVLGTATLGPTATVSGARAIATTNLVTTAGAHSIVASWPGDTNYTPITTSAVTVTVQSGTATSVAVTSNANPAVLGGRPTFTATMTPTTVTSGTVNFFDGGVLLGSGTVGAAHTATLRPAAAVNLPAGVHQITAFYAGNATFNSSTSPAFAQTFNQAATTITLTVKTGGTWGQTFAMSGVLGTLVAATPPSGTLTFLDSVTPLGTQGFSTVPAARGGFGIFQASQYSTLTAGTHTITATLSDPNYTAPTSATQTITVNKANPTLTATGGTFTYNGSPHGGSGSAKGGNNETLAVTLSYAGTGATTYGPTATAPSSAGTYGVTAATAGDSNNNTGNSTPAALIINKGSSTTNATGGTFTYDGTPHAGSGTSTGAAGETLTATLSYSGTGATTYGPTATAPTNAGTYSVTAATTGDGNNNSSTSTPAALTINKANATVTVTGGTFTYDGTPKAGSGSATGGAGESLAVTLAYTGTGATTYGPTASAPTNAGTYTVTAATAGDANNNSGTSTPAALTINQAGVTITAMGGTFTYDGTPHAGSGTATGAGGATLTVTLNYTGTGATTYGPTATAPTNAGTYQVVAHTPGNANNVAADSAPAALVIDPAKATVNVTGYCALFDSGAHQAAGSATGVGGAAISGLNLAGTSHTSPGTYLADAWSFSNPNYTGASGTVDDAIVSNAIAAASLVQPGSVGNPASVPDAGAGATYTWTISGGTIEGGNGTRSITFTASSTGTVSAVTLGVKVSTTTGCSQTGSVNVSIGAPTAQVPTLSSLGLALLVTLLAGAGVLAVRRRRATE